jgi:hypothetical protein
VGMSLYTVIRQEGALPRVLHLPGLKCCLQLQLRPIGPGFRDLGLKCCIITFMINDMKIQTNEINMHNSAGQPGVCSISSGLQSCAHHAYFG